MLLKDEHLLEVKEAGRAIAALAEDERSFTQAVKAFETGDRDAFRQALDHRGLLPHCLRICFWFCIWRCIRVCRLICVDVPIAAPTPGDLVELARLLQPLRDNPDLLKRCVDAMDKRDHQTLGGLVRELKIQRFCFFVCYWICFLRCRRFCIRICAGPQIAAAEPDPLAEVRDSIEALAAIGKDEGTLVRAIEAFRKQDSKEFHAILRSEEHTSELQSLRHLVCRLLLE